ncbi:MAG: glutamine amidotransferase subunit PdxT [Haloplasmataceae bacterium]|jgi:5'-phosphate synthase pdxT subunit|nr:glutamine amidotransferase subunit PdxT [Haloplasmataceae bacterium]
MKIGILALQGSYFDHQKYFSNLNVDTLLIKEPHQLKEIDGLVLPGGESTTIRRLIDRYNFMDDLKDFCSKKPVFGTCAGMILLAKEVVDNPTHIGVLNVRVKRNAFGRQKDSFEEKIMVNKVGEVEGVYIRAPYIDQVGDNVEVLAIHKEIIVAVQQDNILATSFHPELTDNLLIGKYFINMIDKRISKA